MGFLSSVIRPKASVPTYGPTDDRSYFPGGAYYGASPLSLFRSPESAMRQMTVNNCVRVLYNCVSQMPCQLMEEDENEKKSKAQKHYLYKIVGKRPNSWMTAPQFFGMAIVHLCLRGNFYAYKARVGTRIKELLPLHPDRVQVSQGEDWSLTYKVNSSKGQKEYTRDDIFHIRGLSLDGITGINPIEYARQCIYNGMSTEEFVGRYFSQGMNPGAIVTLPPQERLSVEEQIAFREALKKAYAGLNKSREPLVLTTGSTIEFPQIKLVDQQFLEEQRFTESQICGMYGVPLMLVQAGDNPESYASASEFKRTFVDMTLTPIAVNFETTIDRDCLTDSEQERYYAKFNLNSLLRGNPKERAEFYKELINCEVMCPNEPRMLEDLNPYEQGWTFRTRTSTTKENTSETEEKGAAK